MSRKVEAYFIIHTIDLVVRESEWIKCGLRRREKKDTWMEKLEPTFGQIIMSAKENWTSILLFLYMLKSFYFYV